MDYYNYFQNQLIYCCNHRVQKLPSNSFLESILNNDSNKSNSLIYFSIFLGILISFSFFQLIVYF